MGEMASALAHEINQPFSAIATYVRTARWLLQKKQKQRNPEIEEILDKAGAQAMRAGEIIRRLREFVTRGDSVKTVQRLSALVDEATALAFAGSRKNDARVSVATDAQDDFVLADRVQIQQVVVNLMRNAVEAMDGAQKRELSLSTSVADGFVRLDVADSGHGLSEDMRRALFTPFRTTKANGMGLGLSISRSIVEAHGGRIWAEPNPRGGAIFSFTLPQARAEARPE
jgi:two-component system sensor kinase FixL